MMQKMTNIPTELLRALVAIAEERSFTKAAIKLGVSQPAVSSQIKRLQILISNELFNRDFPGVVLTPQGELVVAHARRILSINDQIVQTCSVGPRPELMIRIGTPSDFIASTLPNTLAQFRARWPQVRFTVRADFYHKLMRQLRTDDLDVLLAMSLTPQNDARHSRARESVWVHRAGTGIERGKPVPLVSFGNISVYHQLAVMALKSAGLEWEEIFIGPSLSSLRSAVAAGLGVMAISRRRAIDAGMTIWQNNTPLPKLPNIYAGIYVRKARHQGIYEQLADELAANLWSK